MKPAPFEYLAPRSLAEALELMRLHGGEAKLLAGGQSLIPVMNFRLAQPALLIDLNRLEELDFVRQAEGGGVRLGALSRQRRVEHDPLVAAHAPLLHEAIPFIAHPQIRNRGTVGGCLAHADPAAELPAVTVALGARFLLAREGGERWVPATEFYAGLFETALEPEEILTEIEVPPMASRSGCCFIEVARRHGDYAQVGVAALVTLESDGRCREARLVYLSVGDTPVAATRAAQELVGGPVDEERFAAAAAVASQEEIDPAGDIHASADFKRHLTRVLTVRALRTASQRAANGSGEAR